jgi:hypothetical protein
MLYRTGSAISSAGAGGRTLGRGLHEQLRISNCLLFQKHLLPETLPANDTADVPAQLRNLIRVQNSLGVTAPTARPLDHARHESRWALSARLSHERPTPSYSLCMSVTICRSTSS